MHDLVHDLAISLLGNELVDKTKQEWSVRLLVEIALRWLQLCPFGTQKYCAMAAYKCRSQQPNRAEDTMGRSRHYQYVLLGDCNMPLWLTRAAQLIALRFLNYRITKLCGAAFAPATSLRVLDLSECSIQKLPDSIGKLKELRYLSAPWVRDRMFPECITKLSHLIYLNLYGSAIKEIPESIGEMKDLMHLNLSGCKIIWGSPNSLMSLENLVHLDFPKCSLLLGESESFSSLSRLQHLSLSECKINGDLAKALWNLTELQYLDLSQVDCSGNLSRGLHLVLLRFTKLRYLNICRVLDKICRLIGHTEIFIEAISSLSSLEYLNLGWNKSVYNIPESIGKLSKLCTLDLSHCVNLERLPTAISGIDTMKFLHVSGCDSLDKSSIALYKNVTMLLPYFVVHANDSESGSNLYQLEYENPTKLEMSGLENVKSAGEAQRIMLVEKQRIEELGLVWTPDAKRFVVEDKDVLEQLVPPSTLERIRLQGYNSAGFSSWMMDIATYVPHLVNVTLEDMPNCSSLPPLGQLPNLKYLYIGRMDSITKIGLDLYGDGGFKKRVFPQLRGFTLKEMKCLEEWNTSYSYPSASGEDDSNKELAFPNLQDLTIADCPMLRFKSLSLLVKNMRIIRSGQVISSSWECSAKFDASSSAATTFLRVQCCEAPLHQWSLLRRLPCLTELHIVDCSVLTCSSTDLLRCLSSLKALYVSNCKNIAALPERLGDLTSLERLEVSNCEGLKALPKSIKKLTCLQHLQIYGCPQLVQLPQRLGDLTSLKKLVIRGCGVRALPESTRQLTRLQYLQIFGCPQLVQLVCPPSLETLSFESCKSIAALPERLGDLSSLKYLEIVDCEGVKALPESIQQLTNLECLRIDSCPELVRWCKSEQNKMKLAHIGGRILDFQLC